MLFSFAFRGRSSFVNGTPDGTFKLLSAVVYAVVVCGGVGGTFRCSEGEIGTFMRGIPLHRV